MLDSQTGVVALAAVCAVILFLVLPSALVEGHSRHRTWLSRGDRISFPKIPRGSLLVEIPIIFVIIGASQLVMVAAAISSISGVATRAIGVLELVAFLIWMTDLIRTIRRPERD